MFRQKGCYAGIWGKTPVQTLSNLFLKILIDGAVNLEAGSLFQYSKTLTETRTLKYLVGMLPYAASSGREKKHVWIHIQKALEYLEGGNEVIPKSSPLQE